MRTLLIIFSVFAIHITTSASERLELDASLPEHCFADITDFDAPVNEDEEVGEFSTSAIKTLEVDCKGKGLIETTVDNRQSIYSISNKSTCDKTTTLQLETTPGTTKLYICQSDDTAKNQDAIKVSIRYFRL